MTVHYGVVLREFDDVEGVATFGIFEELEQSGLSLMVWADVEIKDGEIESVSFTGELEPHNFEEGGLLDDIRDRLEREVPKYMKEILEFDPQQAYNFIAEENNYEGNADCYFELVNEENCKGLVTFEI